MNNIFRETGKGRGGRRLVDRTDHGGVHHAAMDCLPRCHVGPAGVALGDVGAGHGLAFRPADMVLGDRRAQVRLVADDAGRDLADAVGTAVAEARKPLKGLPRCFFSEGN